MSMKCTSGPMDYFGKYTRPGLLIYSDFMPLKQILKYFPYVSWKR